MAVQKKQYGKWLGELKKNIQLSRIQISLKVNTDMLILYWYIGKQISEKVEINNWGAKIIEQLAEDLQNAFPEESGFSLRNLKYMKQYAEAYPNLLTQNKPKAAIGQQAVAQLKNSKNTIGQQAAALIEKPKNVIGQQLVAQFDKIDYFLSNPLLVSIPWGHHVTLLDKIYEYEERYWYIEKTNENNWSRSVLRYQIETDLYARQYKKKKATNFHLTLPKPQSDLANQMLKDPYIFGFVQLGENISERELEQALIKHIQEFIIELGAGFAFVGRQVKFKIGRKEKQLDLLFYHLYLRCYIVFELKMEEFDFAHTGQMNGYLNIVNKQLKHETDNPSIGIILCSEKDSVEVDFALTNINHPIGVSEYTFSKILPKNIRDKMPTAKQLQQEVKRFLELNKCKPKDKRISKITKRNVK